MKRVKKGEQNMKINCPICNGKMLADDGYETVMRCCSCGHLIYDNPDEDVEDEA